MRVIILRHGETTSNLEKRIQGQTDTKLNATGEAQAEKVGELLRQKEKIDAVYSSDLSRAFRTAELVAGDDVEVIPVEGFRERHMGPIEGMLHADALKKRNKDSLPSLLSYGENGAKLTDRVVAAYDKTVAEAADKGYKTIVIVSHGSALYHLFDVLKKRYRVAPVPGARGPSPVQQAIRSNAKLGNCAVTIIDDDQFVAYAEQWVHSIKRERTLV